MPVKLLTSGGGGINLVPSSSIASDQTMYLPTSGTSGGTVLCTDSSGNLGIGTSSPAYALQINRSGSASYVGTYDGTGLVLSGVNGSGLGLYGTFSNSPLAFFTNSTERMRIDSSGNLGLGVTPSGWSSSYRVIQNTSGFFSVDGNAANYTTIYGNNAYYSSSNSRWEYYRSSNGASLYRQNNGSSGLAEHAWYTAPSGTAGNPITFAQAMTLDSSGNLQVNGGIKCSNFVNDYSNTVYLSSDVSVGNIVTVIPTGIMSAWSTYIVTIFFHFRSIYGAPYYASASMLFNTNTCNGYTDGAFVALPTSTHAGDGQIFAAPYSVAGNTTQGLKVKTTFPMFTGQSFEITAKKIF